MEEETNRRTTRDQLTYEMLGDLGRLHDQVESLKDLLPGQMEQVESKITGLIGLLNKAGDVYQDRLKKFTSAEVAEGLATIKKESAAAKAQFELDTNAAVRTTLAEVQRSVKSSLNKEIDAVEQALRSPFKQNLWFLALCLTCGMFGGTIVYVGGKYHFDETNSPYLKMGKAVSASWDKLDPKAKAIINAKSAELN